MQSGQPIDKHTAFNKFLEKIKTAAAQWLPSENAIRALLVSISTQLYPYVYSDSKQTWSEEVMTEKQIEFFKAVFDVAYQFVYGQAAPKSWITSAYGNSKINSVNSALRIFRDKELDTLNEQRDTINKMQESQATMEKKEVETLKEQELFASSTLQPALTEERGSKRLKTNENATQEKDVEQEEALKKNL